MQDGMLRAMDVAARFGHTVLVHGPESLLAERAVAKLIASAREERPGASVTRLDGATLEPGKLAEAVSGSLFASDQIVVIEGADAVPSDLVENVQNIATQPPSDLALIVVHPGGVRGKALLDRLKKARVEVVSCAAVKAWELPQFAMAEARAAGGRLDKNTATLLVEALSPDMRTVASAVRQLIADCEGDTITEDVVKQYFSGRADVSSFNVAEAMADGRREEAMRLLRWALDTGASPAGISSAVAGALRGLGRYHDVARSRMRENEIASAIGVPPWKVKKLAQQARSWTPGGLAASIQATARVDAEIKGAASDPGFSLEQLVIEVTAQWGRRP